MEEIIEMFTGNRPIIDGLIGVTMDDLKLLYELSFVLGKIEALMKVGKDLETMVK